MTTETRIQIFTAALMSLLMSALLSGFFTWLDRGFTFDWLATWAGGFAMAWPLAFALVLAIGPRVRTLAVRLAKSV